MLVRLEQSPNPSTDGELDAACRTHTLRRHDAP